MHTEILNKFSFFILNIGLNSLLVFLTTLLLIEILIVVLRIKQGRLASYLRMIPIFKLSLDPFLYDFSRWSYLQDVNPLNCQEGTRTLSAMFGTHSRIFECLPLPFSSGIQMTVYNHLTFTLADIIGYSLSPGYLIIFAILFGLTTIFIFLKDFKQYLSCILQSKNYNKFERIVRKKIHNCKLKSSIKKYSLNIIVTAQFHGSPYVAGLKSPIIFIPHKLLLTLSQKEYEAILAHEIEHVRYKDNLILLILNMICSFFWWVPTRWLRNRIEEGQERGCDAQCKKYGVNPLDLASAINKSAKSISLEKPFLAYSLSNKHTVSKRIHALLSRKPHGLKKTRFILAVLAASVAFFGILLGRFWIF